MTAQSQSTAGHSPFSAGHHSDVRTLRDPAEIRRRAAMFWERARRDRSATFTINERQLEPCAKFVAEITRRDYPTLDIPYHSRWRHFDVGTVARTARILDAVKSSNRTDLREQARVMYDLVVVSVLLDAGAGMSWSYAEDGKRYSKSEGLAVASINMFAAGAFADSPKHPLRADAKRLRAFADADLEHGFQVKPENPLVGVSGRAGLLRALGSTIAAQPKLFPGARPGGMVDVLCELAGGLRTLPARVILDCVLEGLGPIWPSRITLHGSPLGDVWPHADLPSDLAGGALMPFHKLSQWLTYSLIEPLEQLGIAVTGINELTGLPEYRNGGLFWDFSVIQPRDPKFNERTWTAAHPEIVEWRALTVHLLDQMGVLVAQIFGLDRAALPLAKVLQGGTWTAGREIARKLRADGGPPFPIKGDGTTF